MFHQLHETIFLLFVGFDIWNSSFEIDAGNVKSVFTLCIQRFVLIFYADLHFCKKANDE